MLIILGKIISRRLTETPPHSPKKTGQTLHRDTMKCQILLPGKNKKYKKQNKTKKKKKKKKKKDKKTTKNIISLLFAELA